MPKHCVSIVFAASPIELATSRAFLRTKATNMLEIRQMGDHMSPCADKRARCDFRHPLFPPAAAAHMRQRSRLRLTEWGNSYRPRHRSRLLVWSPFWRMYD